jgi:hypothetical protein
MGSDGSSRKVARKGKRRWASRLLGGAVNLAMGPEEAVEALFGRSIIEDWALTYANTLETCVEDLHKSKHSHGGCRAAVYDIQPFGWDTGLINFKRDPAVSWCEGMSKDTREVHWCHFISNPPVYEEGLE